MHPFLLVAALASQITFLTERQQDIYTITPQVVVTQPCVCQIQILTVHAGVSGQSNTQQRKTLSLHANQPTKLARLSMNISPKDTVKVVVTVTDGANLHLVQQWPAEQ